MTTKPFPMSPMHDQRVQHLIRPPRAPLAAAQSTDSSSRAGTSKKRKPPRSSSAPVADVAATVSAFGQRQRHGSAMTNAERGRAFRARKNKHVGEMEVDIYRLRTEIAELESVRAMWESTRLLAAKTSDTGSLTRLVHEYFTLFRYGLQPPVAKDVSADLARPSIVSADVVMAKISCQEHFLRQTMAHDAVIGDNIGPEASIANWGGYTYAHGRQRIDISHIHAVGSADHLVTQAHVTFNGTITMNTFRALYPGAIHRQDLLAVFLHRSVRFHAVFRHEFSADGKIQFEGVEIGFVDGLLGTGASLSDVLELLRLSIMSPAHTIADRVELLDSEDKLLPDPAAPEKKEEDGDKLRVEYILTP